MSDMVERVARAICSATGSDPDHRRTEEINVTLESGGNGCCVFRLETVTHPPSWTKFVHEARAAIEAILSEDDIWLLASAAENLRGGSQDAERRAEAAFRIAFNLDKLRRRFDAALKGEAE